MPKTISTLCLALVALTLIVPILLTGGIASADVPLPPCTDSQYCGVGATFSAGARLAPMFLAGVYTWWTNIWK